MSLKNFVIIYRMGQKTKPFCCCSNFTFIIIFGKHTLYFYNFSQIWFVYLHYKILIRTLFMFTSILTFNEVDLLTFTVSVNFNEMMRN